MASGWLGAGRAEGARSPHARRPHLSMSHQIEGSPDRAKRFHVPPSAGRISRGRRFHRLPPDAGRIARPPRLAGGSIMTDLAASAPRRSPMLALVDRLIGLLDGVPYWLLALPLRVAVATVFWNSAMAKLANWDTTIELFTDDYKVPLLPPEIAANLALSIELTTPVLLVLGLLTRAAALVLLGMTAVIEIFVFPLAWPTHIQWAAMLLVLLCRGAGRFSVDEWIARHVKT